MNDRFNPKGRSLPSSIQDGIVRMYLDREDLSVSRVAKEFGVSETGARNALLRAEIKIRPANNTPHVRRDALILSSFRRGIPQTRIAVQFNLSRERVRQIIAKAEETATT